MKQAFLFSLIFLPVSGFGQELTEKQVTFLSTHSKIIADNANFSDSNWEIIADEFKDKIIVLLGEFNHGSKEVVEIRNSLIKYLHKKQNFDVILFESGIGELIIPNLKKHQLSPTQMTHGFFGGWRTREFTELMKYIKEADMQIAGYDVQRTGRSFNKVLRNTVSSIVSDSTRYTDLEQRYSVISNELRQDKTFKSLQLKTEKLIADYLSVHNEISKISPKTSQLLLVQKTLLNRIAYLQYYLNFRKDNDWSKRWAARDSAMADNVLWVANNIYPGRKIIVIGHNFHISQFNEKETVMGEILSKNYGDKMYSVGTFAGEGSYANNAGEEEFMSLADSTRTDLKHIIDALKGYAAYLPIKNYNEKGSEWLNEKIIVNDTFIDLYGSDSMVLSKHFDGLLLLKHVSPANKKVQVNE